MPKQKNNKKKNEPGWSEVTLRFHPISKSQTLAQLSLRGVAKTHAFVVPHFLCSTTSFTIHFYNHYLRLDCIALCLRIQKTNKLWSTSFDILQKIKLS